MFKAVLFDLDGTLIQSTEVILETYQLMIDTYFEGKRLTDEEFTNFLGSTLIDSFSKFTNDEKLIQEVIDAYRNETKRRLATELKTYPNAKEVVLWLKKKKVKVGIVTSKSRAVAEENLRTVGLDDLFDLMIAFEDVTQHKPNPEGLLKAMDMLGFSKEEVVYIGDHENDIIASKKAGIMSCSVTYSNRFEQVIKENPTFVIDELLNVKDMI